MRTNVLLAFQPGMTYEVRHGSWAESSQEQSVNSPFPVSTWTHVAVVQSRTGDATTGPAKIYWDGVEVASTDSMNFPLLVGRSGLYVGKSHWPDDPMFTGSMRGLLVWDIALTTAELDAVRLGGGLPTSTAPLVSMMRTWCGAAPPPSPPPSPPPVPPASPCSIDGAFTFTGDPDSYLTAVSRTGLVGGGTGFTLSAWVYRTHTDSSWDRVIDFGSGPDAHKRPACLSTRHDL